MTTTELETVRNRTLAREDFLVSLRRRYRPTIHRIMLANLGPVLSKQYIDDGCQEFMLAANRAISTAKPELSDPLTWIVQKGLLGVLIYMRAEFGHKVYSPRKFFARRFMFESHDFAGKYEPRINPLGRYYDSTTTFENRLVSALTVQDEIEQLEPRERSIVSLLVFGRDDFGPIRCANSHHRKVTKPSTIGHVAATINETQKVVYNTVVKIRSQIPKEAFA